ncbi:MAG: substrate-binding domain-containing protein, partial [Pseudomonadota bacterium]
CGGDLPALAVLAAIRDCGLTPGVDVEVYAKQTSDVLDHTHPAIDTCVENIQHTGRALAELLLKAVEGSHAPAELATLIAPEYRLRTEQP